MPADAVHWFTSGGRTLTGPTADLLPRRRPSPLAGALGIAAGAVGGGEAGRQGDAGVRAPGDRDAAACAAPGHHDAGCGGLQLARDVRGAGDFRGEPAGAPAPGALE